MASPTTHFVLPKVLEKWPYERKLNIHHHEVKRESEAWLESSGVFDPSLLNAYRACNVGLFASLAYPLLQAPQLRVGHDLAQLILVLDECTDNEDAASVRRICDTVMSIFQIPQNQVPLDHREPIYAQLALQFWTRAMGSATIFCRKRFVESFRLYLESVVEEARDKKRGRVRGIKSYMAYRRHSAGSYPVFSLIQQCMNISDEIFDHPVLKELDIIAGDLLILLNDMYSYNMEQSRGLDGHNIIPVAMHELSISLQEAYDWTGARFQELESRFLDTRNQLPCWGKDADNQVKEYVEGLGCVVRAFYCWSFEAPRYFGNCGAEIEKTRIVRLLPKARDRRS